MYGEFHGNISTLLKFFLIISWVRVSISNPVVDERENIAITQTLHPLPLIIIIYDLNEILDICLNSPKFHDLIIALSNHSFPSIPRLWRFSLRTFKSLSLHITLANQELYIPKVSAIYSTIPNTQNAAIPFESSVPLITSVCIILLEFIDFQNVQFQSTFDSRLEKLAITSFQPWVFYLDAFGASIRDG